MEMESFISLGGTILYEKGIKQNQNKPMVTTPFTFPLPHNLTLILYLVWVVIQFCLHLNWFVYKQKKTLVSLKKHHLPMNVTMNMGHSMIHCESANILFYLLNYLSHLKITKPPVVDFLPYLFTCVWVRNKRKGDRDRKMLERWERLEKVQMAKILEFERA